MDHIQMEPIVITARRPQTANQQHPHGQGAAAAARPANVEALVNQIQREFPGAQIRITGRGRTVRRQAELMAQSRRANRQGFLGTYRAAPHITEMDIWMTAHPTATLNDTVNEFEAIINRARQGGAAVSNHLADRARDISIPVGGHEVQQRVRDRIQALGGHVIDERDAAGGPHWHVDY
jgi:hypothetical protein